MGVRVVADGVATERARQDETGELLLGLGDLVDHPLAKLPTDGVGVHQVLRS